jgi:hypothetical protein
VRGRVVNSVAVPKVVFTLIQAMLGRLVLLFRSADDKDAEIHALRHQLGVLQRQVPRPRFTPADPTILAVLGRAIRRHRLGEVMLLVKPATVIG